MRMSLFALSVSLLTGCLTATVPSIRYWTVAPNESVAVCTTPKYGVVRVSQVLVRSPYDSRPFVLRRSDGSLAFDAYNQFASLPSQLVKGPVIASLASSGLCKTAVGSSSSAHAEFLAEVVVEDLSLASESDASLNATVSILVRMLDHRRDVVAVVRGAGASEVRGGAYSAAFSAAFEQALKTAFSRL